EAVCEYVKKGNLTTLNAPEEVYLAEKLIELHPWAHMVRFAKTGGESMAIAIRIARAKTKKDVVLFCGYHGWHDWYLSANLNEEDALKEHLLTGLNPLGVPKGLKDTAYSFKYNDVGRLKELAFKLKDKIGAIVMEPIRNTEPTKEFFDTIHNIRDDLKIALIVDEITAGFRLCNGGAHKLLGLDPDIAVFGKALGNGYPIGAIIGKEWVMDVAQDTFISSTYWTERSGLVASLKTLDILQRYNIPKFLDEAGKKVKIIWEEKAKKYELKIHISGINPLAHFSFEYENPLELKTLFTQEMLERGFLASTAFYASFAHAEDLINLYEKAVDEVFYIISKAIKNNTVKKLLKTEVCHAGFKRLT
ncbi:MAG TPA: aminotransferase class III-fold pyridoxal phosphate-dependent enzyme, partial [Hydrogenobaculum sp.]|nr:aminotransferase class III-fold pyridoxal phosphate-dependent enzyme [Hydrogenobaculum sp.]